MSNYKIIFVLQVKSREMERRPFIATGSRSTRIHTDVGYIIILIFTSLDVVGKS